MRWHHFTAELSEDPATGGSCVITHSTDITEKVRTENRLLDAPENSPAAIALYDADDRLVVCNSRYRSTFAIPGRLPDDRHQPGVRFEDVLRAFTEAGGNPEAGAGVDSWIEERARRHRDPQGSVERHIGQGNGSSSTITGPRTAASSRWSRTSPSSSAASG